MNKQIVLLQQKKKKALNALKNKDFTKAKKLLQEVCKKAPKDGQAWFLLSAVKGESGDFAGVIKCCKRVLALDSRNVQAYSNLGNAYASLNQHEEAIQAYGKALALAPKNPIVLHNLGNALLLDGKVEEAIEKFEATIALQPDYADAYYCLAGALEAEQQPGKAIGHYKTALLWDSQSLEIHFALGTLLGMTGRPEDAVSCYLEALEAHPKSAELYQALAYTQHLLGNYDDAFAAYEKALRIKNDDPLLIAGVAQVYSRKAEYDEAYKRVRSLVEREELNGMAAMVYLEICRRYDGCDEAVSLAAGLLDSGSLNADMAAQVHKTLGKLYDKQGDFDEAFDHFYQGNELSKLTYDAAEQTAKVDGQINAFSAESIGRLPRAVNRSEKPILIVGMPRSGTTLVEQIIARHPQAFGAGELKDLHDLISPLSARGYPQIVADIAQSELDEMAEKYLDRLAGFSPESKRVTDKMPANFMHLGLAAIMLPGVRVIHCVRDPLDSCLSIYFQRFNLNHTYARDLASLGHYCREYQRVMAHWKTVLDIPILDVHYSELVADQEKVSREMLEFCGLEWDDRCLQFYEDERHVATVSYDQVRQPMYTSSLARWKNYEKHLGPLKEALGL